MVAAGDDRKVMLQVGRIGRAHGVGGEVRVTLSSERVDRLDPGSELTTDTGTLRVVSSRPHNKSTLVRFEGVDGRDAADALRGMLLYAPAGDEPEGLWVHQIVGLQVRDVDGGEHGTVVAVEANPAHDLLVLEDGTLVPVVFVVDVGDVVVVDAPDGLLS